MQRFWDRVDKTDNCWQWKGLTNAKGYGRFKFRNKELKFYKYPSGIYAHRFSYELLRGKIPKGLVIDHLCENTSCVNPEHLEPVTQRENLMRGATLSAIAAAKTHCSNGHLFSVENTYLYKGVKRMCRTCLRDNALKHYRTYHKVTV